MGFPWKQRLQEKEGRSWCAFARGLRLCEGDLGSWTSCWMPSISLPVLIGLCPYAMFLFVIICLPRSLLWQFACHNPSCDNLLAMSSQRKFHFRNKVNNTRIHPWHSTQLYFRFDTQKTQLTPTTKNTEPFCTTSKRREQNLFQIVPKETNILHINFPLPVQIE